ncbi:hypothetical protein Csa_023191 [Cucumis sativus]|nr:hypothetical protein Csa_023191 [Cucumis sativus]
MDWSELQEERENLKLIEKYQCFKCILPIDGDHASHSGLIDAKLFKQLCDGIYIDNGNKMYWFDEKAKGNAFFIPPRGLKISFDRQKLIRWKDSEFNGEITFLEARGKIKQHMLSSTLTYDVLFELLCKPYATGYHVPTNFEITYPKAITVVIKENLESRPPNEWFTIKVGEIKVDDKHDCDSDKEYEFSMNIHSEDRKSELVFKGVQIRPKQPSYGTSSFKI